MAYTVAVAVRLARAATQRRSLVLHGVVLRVLVVMLFVLHVAQLVRFFFQDVDALSNIVPLAGTVAVYALSVLAFRQSRLFAAREPTVVQGKYEGSTLTPERADEIQEQLLLVLARDKPFMNENMNFAELASRLGIPRAHLSQVINTNLKTNFPSLVNEYRVREAEKLLGDPAWAHLSVEGVGYEVGFGSRSGFHGAFKKITGETPAQTRARLS
jgi:AraC-like DNA-binding protein